MRSSKWLVWVALAVWAAVPGAATLAAQDRFGSEVSRDRQAVRNDYRDLGHDYRNVERIRADMARDQWRLNEAIRCGRRGEAAAISRDLARDRRLLDAQRRDIRRDQYEARRDRQDIRSDYRYGWR